MENNSSSAINLDQSTLGWST